MTATTEQGERARSGKAERTMVPKAGEVASKGSLVDLKVSQGVPPDNVKLVPDLRNRSLDEAQTWSKRESVSLVVRESTMSAAVPAPEPSYV